MDVENDTGKESFWDFKGTLDYVDEWPLMGSPYPVVLILFSYLYFVLKCGPQFMKDRPPYGLHNLLLIYNIGQVCFSICLFVKGINAISEKGLIETQCLMNDEKIKFGVTSGHYLYFIAKLTELLDTVFFVLRKKWNQISFLHVYHHSIMFLFSWITLKYEPTYSMVFLGTFNAFVHIIMYTYYGLAAFPSVVKYLWWKKYITRLQLFQFVFIFIQVTVNTGVSECPASYILVTTCWAHTLLFVYLFSDFYKKSYTNKVNGTDTSNVEKIGPIGKSVEHLMCRKIEEKAR